MKTYPIFVLLAAFFLTFSACQDDDEPTPSCDYEVAPGTRFFEFEHTSNGETYYAWTADTAVINDALAELQLPEAERRKFINGPIARNPEGCQLNGDWSWYFVAGEWELVEFAIEVCDGNPDFVEENIDEFIRIGRYCPWSAIVKQEVEQPF